MIEIIAGVFVTCFALSWLESLAFLFFVVRRRIHSPERKILNENLKKIDLYWSAKNDDFRPIGTGSIEKDDAGFQKSLLIATTFCSLLSFLGFVFLTLFILSVGFLARSRREIRTMESRLTRDPQMSPQDILQLVSELREVF